MNRHLMLIGLSPLGLILASCGSMNDPVYHDPSFKVPSANPEDNSYEEPQAQAASASAASNEPVLVKPKTTVAEANAAAAAPEKKPRVPAASAAATTSSTPKPRVPSAASNSPFIQPDVYNIPSNNELKETSAPINSGGNSRRLSVPSSR